MRFDVGLLAGLPQGDNTFDNVDTSPGINLQFGYNFMPNIGVFVGARYFQIQLKNDVPGLDLGNFDLDFGGRYSVPVSPTAKIFGEAMLIFSTLSADDGTTSDSWSGIGFGARAGGAFTVSGRISIGGAVSYTTATIDVEGEDVNAAWLGIEGFASFGF
jgi:hypothetical protein